MMTVWISRVTHMFCHCWEFFFILQLVHFHSCMLASWYLKFFCSFQRKGWDAYHYCFSRYYQFFFLETSNITKVRNDAAKTKKKIQCFRLKQFDMCGYEEDKYLKNICEQLPLTCFILSEIKLPIMSHKNNVRQHTLTVKRHIECRPCAHNT